MKTEDLSSKIRDEHEQDHDRFAEYYLKLRGAGLDWTVHRRCKGLVQRVIMPHFQHLKHHATTTVVKDNALRTVLRLPSHSGEVFVKIFHDQRLKDQLRSLVQPSKAMIEWRHAMRLSKAGVRTATPAFVCESRQWGLIQNCAIGTYAVPRSEEYSRKLDQLRALPEEQSNERRQLICRRLARLCFNMVSIGALHHDFHIGNVLVDNDDQVYVIDLYSMSFVGRAFPDQKLWMLARVAMSHAPFAHKAKPWARQEVHWLCQAYADYDPLLGPSYDIEERVLKMAQHYEDVRLKSRDKRCLMKSSLYMVHKNRRRPIYHRRPISLEDIEHGLKAEPVKTLHESSRSRVDLIEAPESMKAFLAEARGVEPPEHVVRKRILYPKLSSRLASMVVGSKGLRSWQAARAMEVRELPTALMLAYVEQRSDWFLPEQSVLFMEAIEGSWMLHRYLVEELKRGAKDGGLPERERHQLTRELAEFLVRIQENDIRHHDLAVQNVLVKPEDGGHKLFLIDLDSVQLRPLRSRDRIRNLVQFADLPEQASSTDKLRFFEHYCQQGGEQIVAAELKKYGRKGFIRELAQRLQDKMAAKAKRMARKHAQEQRDH